LLSASLLEAFSVIAYSPSRDTLTVGQFYDEWQGTHASKRFRPFNEGVILSFMYLGILFTRENWPDVIPKDTLSTWGISPTRLIAPKEPNPDLHYLVRRIRNSLGHGSPLIHVPIGTTYETSATQITVTFKDKKIRDPTDTFETELTLGQALHLAKMIHKTATEALAKKYGIIPPSNL
jgi:hypothetical protein